MDYEKFINQLPDLYENWGEAGLKPKSTQFQQVIEQVNGMTTANIMQLLNFAVDCMESDEVYCEIGCFQGSTLIGAMLNHADKIAYAVDDFSPFDDQGENFDKLSDNLALFNIDQQVIFSNQDFEEFFYDLKTVNPETKIGVYFYDGAHDYRSQLLGLLLVKPFLSEQALIIVDDSNWSAVQQANFDFLLTHPQCKLLLDLPTPQNGHSTFWFGIQIFSWNAQQEANYEWSIFANSFHNKQFIKALSDFNLNFEFKEKKLMLKSLEKQALAFHYNHQFEEAEAKYKEILQWDRNNINAYHNLGIIYYNLEQYEAALSMVLKSLEIDPSQDLYYYNLGLVLEKLGNYSQAMGAYQKAMAINPQSINAYNNLGNILSSLGENESAELIYRQAIAANPEHFGSYLNLGNVLMTRQNIDEAIQLYQQALQLKPNHPDTLYNLGVAFATKNDISQSALYWGKAAYLLGKYSETILHYEKFLETQIGDIYFYLQLAEAYKNIFEHEKAIETYKQGIKHYPNQSEFYLWLLMTLQDFDQLTEAINVANEATNLFPKDLSLKLEKQRLLPVIYENIEEIDFYRNWVTKNLENAIRQTVLDSEESKINALKGIGFRTNFYLNYQGKNDIILTKQYGNFVNQIMAANYPQWVKPLSMPPLSKDGKIRLGYVSNSMYGHVVGSLFIGWLKNHNHNQFELYCYATNRKLDSRSKEIELYSHAFYYQPDNLTAICEQIRADDLHLLVFIDIGMHALITQIAALRLAPIQCQTWGHPITSGLSTIDYFLSGDLMEPENGEQHYSEKLIRLPNIGICYEQPTLPEMNKKRSDFQIREDAIVYLSCQSLYKYLPQYDYILATIAARVPQSQFVFIQSNISNSITEKFNRRLQKAFAQLNLNSAEYCVFIPPMLKTDYFNLNLLSDIFLDTFAWSGGHTTLTAIACNLPVVTLPGEFMRGRHSYGILKMLGIESTIAKDESEYIDIAVKLGIDKEFRNKIVQTIIKNHHFLYNDKTCITALEEFYQRVVNSYS